MLNLACCMFYQVALKTLVCASTYLPVTAAAPGFKRPCKALCTTLRDGPCGGKLIATYLCLHQRKCYMQIKTLNADTCYLHELHVATALLAAFGAAAIDCDVAMPGAATVPLYDDKSATCNSMATQTVAVQSTQEVS
jgi:hypothetical protein